MQELQCNQEREGPRKKQMPFGSHPGEEGAFLTGEEAMAKDVEREAGATQLASLARCREALYPSPKQGCTSDSYRPGAPPSSSAKD